MNRLPLHFLAAAALLSSHGSALAADPSTNRVTSRVTAVTVYSDRAMVTREAKAAVAAGLQELIVTHLPAMLQDESVRVGATGDARAKILEVKVRRMFLDTVSAARIQPLLQKSREIARRLRALRDRSTVIQHQKEFIGKIGIASDESIARELKTAHPTTGEWKNVLSFFDSELTRLDREAQALEDQTTETQQSYQTVQREIQALGGSPEKSEKQIQVTLDVSGGGTLALRCSYLIAGAGWQPKYDVRVSSADSIANLAYAALVRQNTGEDWNDAKLTLSTSHPSLGGAPPELFPWFIGPADQAVGALTGSVRDAVTGEALVGARLSANQLPGPEASVTSDVNGAFRFSSLSPGNSRIRVSLYGYITVEAVATIRPFAVSRLDIALPPAPVSGAEISLAPGGLSANEVTATGERAVINKNATNAARFDADKKSAAPVAPPPEMQPILYQTAGVSTAATAASFEIPGLTTIPGDNSEHRVTIMVAPLAAIYSHTAVPKLQPDVYYKASLRNATEYPFLPGTMSAFVDNSFVGTSAIRAVMPGEAFDAFLGADNGIRVTRKLLNRISELSGIFSKTLKTSYDILITAENRKPGAQTLTVKENVPVSRSEQIKVEITSPKPEELKPDAEGILTWQLRLAPGEKKEIRLQYSIEAPADLNVGGME